MRELYTDADGDTDADAGADTDADADTDTDTEHFILSNEKFIRGLAISPALIMQLIN